MLLRLRKSAAFIAILSVILLSTVAATVVVYAVSYHTVRINYVYADGSPARDPFVATYADGDEVSITVTNPNIDGFVPMTLNEGVDDPSLLPDGGSEEAKTTFNYDSLHEDVTKTVYYIAGLTPYKVMYYKQNIYDDLYTRDYTVDSQYTDRYGYTGSNPTVLEEEHLFPGFKNLFHEPDSIAADGSTVFRVYYDREYYVVSFDLDKEGYGVEPVYAKYQSVYHIGEPFRPGYTFVGWAQTDKDSYGGTQGTDWNFIDEDGNVITEAQARQNCVKFSEGTVPNHNTHYKAIWDPTTTKYTLAYWIEKPESTLTAADYEGKTDEELFDMVMDNFSVVTSYEVKNVVSGTEVFYQDTMDNYDLFDDAGNLTSAYDAMSPAVKKDLTENKRYYELNETASRLSYDLNGANHSVTVKGDGSTRINIFYTRKEMTLKFFYAKSEGGTLTVDENGNKSLEGGKISLTSGTKNFSVNKQDAANATFKPIITQLRNASFQRPVVNRLPQILKEGLKADFIEDTEKNHRYWFYEIKAKYGADMKNIWFNDAFDTQQRNDRTDPREIVRFGSWAVQEGSRYKVGKTNYTVKGVFERLADEVLLTNSFVDYNLAHTQGFDYTTLYFAASWDNTAASTGDWNGTYNKVYNFTYKNYTQLLPSEDYVIESAGMETFLKGGEYPAGVYSGNDFYFDGGYWEPGKYVDVIENNGIRYGLMERNIIETIDAGGNYHNHFGNVNALSQDIRDNQTAVSLVGYTFQDSNKVKKDYIYSHLDNTNVITESIITNNKNGNPIGNWYDKDGEGGFDENHHADVLFFYTYNEYRLSYDNHNEIQQADSPTAPYGSPLNATPLKIEDPVFPVDALKNYYVFEGWYWDPYYIKAVDYDHDVMPADDTILYAKWVPKKINVSFYPTYNDFYEKKNRIKCVPNPDYDEDDPGDTPMWIDGDITVEYDTYVPLNHIPIDAEDPDDLRPTLVPPAEGAMFAGWYYLRDNVPVRFEPENVTVTALNKDASEHNGKLELFAEWVTKDVAKFKTKYVEAGTNNEVAEPTIGRAFVWKTKTFEAKSGSELNEAHKWVDGARNWWPTVKSHSMVIKSNAQGQEFAPNEYTFEYIQKNGVYYTVRYLDAVTRAELAPSRTDYSTDAVIKEDAKLISGYIAERLTQSMVLAASTLTDEDAQREEELRTNVITFYYHPNDTEYLYEIEYYKQNVEDDGYTLFQSEIKSVQIEEDDPTTVSIADIYSLQFPQLFIVNGCTLVNGATEVVNTPASGTPTTTVVADDANVEITADSKTTIRVYFNRNKYPYSYQYIDYKAEKAYNDASEEERAGMWNGIIETHNGETTEKVEAQVSIPAPANISYEGTPYIRVDDKDIILTIAPNENNPNINLVKVYYKKFTERELRFKLVCANEDDPYTEVDYDPVTHDPLYGGLSTTLQTVDKQEDIQNVNFYNFNDAEKPDASTGSAERYVHLHRYSFLGWFDNPNGEGTPLTTNTTLTKNDLGLSEDVLPDKDTTYYAVVTQDMITADFEFRTVESELPVSDSEATQVVENAPVDQNGDKTGGYFNFSSPSTYQNGSPIPWHRTDGFSVSIEPKDNHVYKYEFAEWWEEDLNTHTLIRHHNWNNTQEGYSPTSLMNQVTRNKDKHIIAVYKRRNVTELPYTLNYNFISRTNEAKTYVKTGVLTGAELDEKSSEAKITADGDFRLTDEFILANAPYESNFGEVLNWTDNPEYITKASEKGDSNEGTVDRIITDVNALQSTKNVIANFQTTPGGEYQSISIPYGSNYLQSPNMLAIEAAPTYGGQDFAYWEVRKTQNGKVVAKSYDPLFDLCMMDNYWITPVYKEYELSNEKFITLTHIENTRNTWTDENNEVPQNGSTDKLYADFEIAFKDGAEDIFTAPEGTYRTGVVFEQCEKLGEGEVFDPSKDYGMESNEENLKNAVLNKASKYAYGSDPAQTRKLQVSDIPQSVLTNRDRVQYSRSYKNGFKIENGKKSFTNGAYLLKATAYIVKDNNVTLSNSVYVCLLSEAEKDLAVNSGIVITNNG